VLLPADGDLHHSHHEVMRSSFAVPRGVAMSVAVATDVLDAEKETMFALLQRLKATSTAFAAGGIDLSAMHRCVSDVERWIFSFDGEEGRTAALLEELSVQDIAAANEAYSTFEFALEAQFAHRLCSGEVRLEDYPLYRRTSELVRRELALVPVSPDGRMLLIGSGPLPISAIHAQSQAGWPVDCMIENHAVAAIAAQTLQVCGVGDSIRILNDNAAGVDIAAYDVIVVDLRTRSSKTLLKSLRKRSRHGCRILYRTSTGLRQLLYKGTLDGGPPGFHMKTWQVARGEQTVSTCLLETAASAMAGIQLRWLEALDAATASQILHLMNRTLEHETTIGYPGPLDEHTGAVVMSQLASDIQGKHRHVLVAEKDGIVVGQLILTPNSTPNHSHIVELTRGTIDVSFRGTQLAFHAFRDVANKCVELRRDVICLDVRAGTAAAIWWQHFGFKPYGRLPDYSRVKGKTYEGLYLWQTTSDLERRLKELDATCSAPVVTGPTKADPLSS
jgi:hypothetical protein